MVNAATKFRKRQQQTHHARPAICIKSVQPFTSLSPVLLFVKLVNCSPSSLLFFIISSPLYSSISPTPFSPLGLSLTPPPSSVSHLRPPSPLPAPFAPLLLLPLSSLCFIYAIPHHPLFLVIYI